MGEECEARLQAVRAEEGKDGNNVRSYRGEQAKGSPGICKFANGTEIGRGRMYNIEVRIEGKSR
jgi:hypothetical protein